MNSKFIKLLKTHTSIDDDFIEEFLSDFKINQAPDKFHIIDEKVANYLEINLLTLRRRLQNTYTKNKAPLFNENVDYVKVKKTANSPSVMYLLNFACFERIAMSGTTDTAETVRLYFSQLRKFIHEHSTLIDQAMKRNYDDLKKYEGFETIYFFAANERAFKVGRSEKIVKRIRNYNVGKIDDTELKYLALVKNSVLIERCLKNKLKPFESIRNCEVYQIEPSTIEKIINECYCLNVSKKSHGNLLDEISTITGFYSYVKDKKTIKPYIVIHNSLNTKTK